MTISAQDFTKGVDFTARTDCNASELNQLVDAAKPSGTRGIIVVSTDTYVNGVSVPQVPTSIYSRYIWKRTKIDATNTPVETVWYGWDDSDYISTGELAGTCWKSITGISSDIIETKDTQFFTYTSVTNPYEARLKLNAEDLREDGYLPVQKILTGSEVVDVRLFGYVGDGTSHPLFEKYNNVNDMRAAYPNWHLYAMAQNGYPANDYYQLSDEQDWAAIQEAVAYCWATGKQGLVVFIPSSHAILNRQIAVQGCVTIRGDRRSKSTKRYATQLSSLDNPLRGTLLDWKLDVSSPRNPYLGVAGAPGIVDNDPVDPFDPTSTLRFPFLATITGGTAWETFKRRSCIWLAASSNLENISILFSDQYDLERSKTAVYDCAYAILVTYNSRVSRVFIYNAFRGMLFNEIAGCLVDDISCDFIHRGIMIRGCSDGCYFNNIHLYRNSDNEWDRGQYPAGNTDSQNDALKMTWSSQYNNPIEHRMRDGIAFACAKGSAQAWRCDGIIISNMEFWGCYAGIVATSTWMHASNVLMDSVVRPMYIENSGNMMFENLFISNNPFHGYAIVNNRWFHTHHWGYDPYPAGVWKPYPVETDVYVSPHPLAGQPVPYALRREWCWHPGHFAAIEIRSLFNASIHIANCLLSGDSACGVLVHSGGNSSVLTIEGAKFTEKFYDGLYTFPAPNTGILGPHVIVLDSMWGKVVINGQLNTQRVFTYQTHSVGYSQAGRTSALTTINGKTAPYLGNEIMSNTSYLGTTTHDVGWPGIWWEGKPVAAVDPIVGRRKFIEPPAYDTNYDFFISKDGLGRKHPDFDKAPGTTAIPLGATMTYGDYLLYATNSKPWFQNTTTGVCDRLKRATEVLMIEPGHRVAENPADAYYEQLADPLTGYTLNTSGATNTVWLILAKKNQETGINDANNWKQMDGTTCPKLQKIENGLRLQYTGCELLNFPTITDGNVRTNCVYFEIPKRLGATAHPAIIEFEIASLYGLSPDDTIAALRYRGPVDSSCLAIKQLYFGVTRAIGDQRVWVWFKELSNWPVYPIWIADVLNPDRSIKIPAHWILWYPKISFPFYFPLSPDCHFAIGWSNNVHTSMPESNLISYVDIKNIKVRWAEMTSEADYLYWCGQDRDTTYPRTDRNNARCMLYPMDFSSVTPVVLAPDLALGGNSYRRLKNLVFQYAPGGVSTTGGITEDYVQTPTSWMSGWLQADGSPSSGNKVIRLMERVGANFHYHDPNVYGLQLIENFMQKPSCKYLHDINRFSTEKFWVPGATYSIGEYVKSDNCKNMFRCIKDGVSDPAFNPFVNEYYEINGNVIVDHTVEWQCIANNQAAMRTSERLDWTSKDYHMLVAESDKNERLFPQLPPLIAAQNYAFSAATTVDGQLVLDTDVPYGGWQVETRNWLKDTRYYRHDYVRVESMRKAFKCAACGPYGLDSSFLSGASEPSWALANYIGAQVAEAGRLIWTAYHIKRPYRCYDGTLGAINGEISHLYTRDVFTLGLHDLALFPPWPSNTAIVAGRTMVLSTNQSAWICTTPGTTSMASPFGTGLYVAGNTVLDNTAVWTCISGNFPLWTPNTAYLIGDTVKSSDGTRFFRCITAGTSDAVINPFDTTGRWDWFKAYGDEQDDNTVRWRCIHLNRGYRQPNQAYVKGEIVYAPRHEVALMALTSGVTDVNPSHSGAMNATTGDLDFWDGAVKWRVLGCDDSVTRCTPILVTAEFDYDPERVL